MKLSVLVCLLFIFCNLLTAQEQRIIIIEEERLNNRLMLFALNKTLTDYDVAITVKGTGFRLPSGAPRKVRVPGRSRVNLINLVIERSQEPRYTYTLDITDSLSKRSLIREAELIKINPVKAITLYIPDNCTDCDTFINALDESPFNYKKVQLSENETIKSQLSQALGTSVNLENRETAIFNVGGKTYLHISSYEELMEKMEE